jgi:tetratricopeptide (TPR) repeat protein
MVGSSGLIGQTISHYRILEKIGGGGMGVVYKAEDTLLGRMVALKFLSEPLAGDTSALQRFQREARLASSLDHPNICTIYEIGQHASLPFIAMQYLEGQTMEQRVAEAPLSIDQVVAMGIQIADALEAAHAKGIIHRDIKPSNIHVNRRNHVKVLDFGVAKLMHELRAGVSEGSARPPTTADVLSTMPGAQVGTYAYMSPEQERGKELDARSDLFSFGLMLYDMATGWHCLSNQAAAAVYHAVVNQEAVVSRSAALPAELANIISKATQVDPALRYQNAAEMRADLERLRGDTAAAPGTTVGVKPIAGVRKYWKAVAFGTGVVLVLYSGGYFYSHRAAKLTEKDKIVLADFANTTNDPVFEDTLRQGLEVQLEQSPFLSLVSDLQIQETLQMMGQKPDAKLAPQTARELCQRVGSAAVLNGSIAQIGTQYLLTVKAVNCVNGESLASAEAQASDKNYVLDALGKMASEIRNKLGESLGSVQKFDTPLVQATTPSLEALQAFSSGSKVQITSGDAAAIPFFMRAIELDPKFARAYGSLAIAYNSIGESGAGVAYARKAYELRDRTSQSEKYFIEAVFHKTVTGNVEAAERSCRLWAQAYPREELPHVYLAGAICPVLGQYAKAGEEAKKAIDLNPDSAVSYAFLMFSYISLNQVDKANAIYDQVLQRKLKNPYLHLALYEIAFLRNDASEMTQEVAWVTGKAFEDALLANEADTAAYRGRLRVAREFSRRAAESAERSGAKEAAATYSGLSGLRDALFGNADEAQQSAKLAVKRSSARDVQFCSALALAYAGDDRSAQMLTDDLGKKFPEDRLAQLNYLLTLQAKLAVSRGNATEAIETLRAATPYELGETTASTYGWNALYPVFVRGEAYLAAHQGSEAAAEFQKILDHRGMVLNQPIGALAHLQLGRAYALQGDTAKARAAYQDFLTLWKEADPDIPVLMQARAEYAKLP